MLVDICQRNGIKELKWKGDKSLIGQPDKQNMTVHRWFANKSCPGEYLYSRHAKIAAEVNARLLKAPTSSTETKPEATPPAVTTDTKNYTKIMSKSVATVDQMKAYIKTKNPNVTQSVIDMIKFYLSEGEAEGVAGDIAFAQSCLETGNFCFAGSAVTLDQNNFCGMGVTSNGMKGNSFDTPQLGIRAQIQHLKAYASTDALVNDCIDPRFKYVARGSAKFVEWLGIKENPLGRGWASAAGYGDKILAILKEVRSTNVETAPPPKPVQTPSTSDDFKTGDLVSLTNDAKYYNGTEVPNWVKAKIWYVHSVSGNRVVINKSEDGKNAIMSPINSMYLRTVKAKPDLPYMVKVDISYLNIRKGPGVNYDRTGQYTGVGIFTIVEVKSGSGSSTGWGKLKSGAGWISLDYTKRV